MIKNNFIINATTSLCPECLKTIPADIIEKNGKILLRKYCSAHGDFEDIYWSDSAIYKKYSEFACDEQGVSNPDTETKNDCPADCGLCPEHKTGTLLVNIDLTNRCNQKCPFCFANSAMAGYLHEPNFRQIKKMLETLQNEKPVPCDAIQFSGGEPTLYPDLIEVVRRGSSPSLRKFHRNTLFIGIMHFMDPYNFDVERVKRCGIHYITPSLKIIPFCSYNIFYREKIEKLFAQPFKK